MALTVADLKWLQRELNEARRLRQWTRELLRGATDRTRPADAHFDGPDAFDGDLWWLLIPLQIDPDGLVRVWSRPDGRCAACQNGNGTRGIWIENREDETLRGVGPPGAGCVAAKRRWRDMGYAVVLDVGGVRRRRRRPGRA